MPVSTVILTKNEENDLPHCLESLYWCSDIHVLDSGSEDTTCEIARTRGAKVATNDFESFGQQRNWALDNLDFASDWILFLDADERSTKGFEEKLIKKINEADESIAGFFCCWKLMLEETWLRRSDTFPRWQMRIVRLGRARFKSVGHGQMEANVEGNLGYFDEPYLHYPFSKGWEHWLSKHKVYAEKEAEQRFHHPLHLRDLFAAHSSARNIALKRLVVYFPCWPLIRFMHAYVWRLGFLEGSAGFAYCRNMARYESMIVRNSKILRRRGTLRKA